MKILLITKKTNQEVLESKIKTLGIVDKDFLERLKLSHEEHLESLESLRGKLTSSGIDYVELKRGMSWPDMEGFDCVLTFGGDGTVLFSSHHLVNNDIPILGIRSSGESVGYLCALDYKSLDLLPGKLANISAETKEVQRLYAEVDFQSGGKLLTPPVLNDFLFANKSPALTTRYSLTLDSHEELQKSSGIWISTAAGSTAAIGTISSYKQNFLDRKFQYKVRELYPHPSRFKLSEGLFDPDKENLSITNFNKKALLAVDGRYGCIDLTIGDRVSFKRAKPLCIFSPSSSL